MGIKNGGDKKSEEYQKSEVPIDPSDKTDHDEQYDTAAKKAGLSNKTEAKLVEAEGIILFITRSFYGCIIKKGG